MKIGYFYFFVLILGLVSCKKDTITVANNSVANNSNNTPSTTSADTVIHTSSGDFIATITYTNGILYVYGNQPFQYGGGISIGIITNDTTLTSQVLASDSTHKSYSYSMFMPSHLPYSAQSSYTCKGNLTLTYFNSNTKTVSGNFYFPNPGMTGNFTSLHWK